MVYSKECPFKSKHIVAMATSWMNSYDESELCRRNPYTEVGMVQIQCLQACSTATITVLVVEQLLGLLNAILVILHPQ